ncbi:chitin deacetylase [Dichotomocladium elegans]|nr:chitin deacetylase [Dichotomocladium elegans]
MILKPIAISVALAHVANVVAAAEYWESFKSAVDPTHITIPSIPQTTSKDAATQCVYYQPEKFDYVASEWPNTWEIATSNGMTETAEFKALYNSIEWSKMPNIPVRKVDANGAIDTSGYDFSSDPDCWWTATTCTVPKHKDINADIYTCPEPETWGLTYDDGPNCSHNAFYDYLLENKYKASMFYIGSNVINWPYGARRGVRDGHHIADHTWSHQMMTTLTNQEVLAELYYTQKAIKLASGVTPRFWRPAYGDVDDRVRWIATQLNLTTILWNLDTDDWAGGDLIPMSTVQHTYDDFIKMGSNGTFSTSGNIVLTHEIDAKTMDISIKNLPAIKKNYKHILDVATCMNITYPYFEKTVSFAPFGSSNVSIASSIASKSGSSTPASAAAAATKPAGTANPSASASKLAESSISGASSFGTSSTLAAALIAFAALIL